MERSKEK